MPFFSSLLNSISGVQHAFGDLKVEIPFGKEQLPSWKQVHGTVSCEVTAKSKILGDCDGVFTRVLNQPIAVVSADCVPVLFAKIDGSAVAAVHAGWRGTYAQILETLWSQLSAQGERPNEWVAALGPSIRKCCYEVSPELIVDFKNRFKNLPADQFIFNERHLDLCNLNELELKRIGIREIENLAPCTFCSLDKSGEPTYHSFRREKKSVRQYSVIQKI